MRCATHSISYSPDQTKLRPPRSAEYYVYARKFYPAGSSKTCLPETNWTWVGSRNSFFVRPNYQISSALVRVRSARAFCDLEARAVHFTIPFFIAQTSSHLRHGQGAGADLSRPFGPLYYRGVQQSFQWSGRRSTQPVRGLQVAVCGLVACEFVGNAGSKSSRRRKISSLNRKIYAFK